MGMEAGDHPHLHCHYHLTQPTKGEVMVTVGGMVAGDHLDGPGSEEAQDQFEVNFASSCATDHQYRPRPSVELLGSKNQQ